MSQCLTESRFLGLCIISWHSFDDAATFFFRGIYGNKHKHLQFLVCVGGAGASEICSGFEKMFEWTTDTKTRRRKMSMLHFKRPAEFLSMGVTMLQPAVNDNYLELLEFEHHCLFERDSR